MNYVQRVPVAICGVALGFAALGNLFKTSFEGLYLACGVLSIALLALYTIDKSCITRALGSNWAFGFRNISDGSYADFGVFEGRYW